MRRPEDNGATISSCDLYNQLIKNGISEKVFRPLSVTFSNNNFLIQALSHTSFVHEFRHLSILSNERLEFLGDSIIGLLVSSYLIKNHPDFNEGNLSKFRGALVNESSLAELARFLRLGDFIFLGKGEITQNGVEKDAILSDGFEALMGAIFLDGGFQKVESAFLSLLSSYKQATGTDYITTEKLENFDSKTKLQEKTMALYKSLPKYVASNVNDVDFKVDLYINGNFICSAIDSSKKKAESFIAREALEKKLY